MAAVIYVMIRTYTTLVRPQLEFCAPVWNPYMVKDCEKLEKVQWRVARWIMEHAGIPRLTDGPDQPRICDELPGPCSKGEDNS